MKKNKIIIISLIIIILVLSIGTYVYLKNYKSANKFYLENKYYGTHEFIEINNDEFSKLKNENYVLYVYNNYCNLPIPCHEIFEKYMKKKDVAFLSMKYEYFKETELHKEVRFAPSIIIVKNGEIVAYLNAEKDADLEKYQDLEEFTKWIEKYIYSEKTTN